MVHVTSESLNNWSCQKLCYRLMLQAGTFFEQRYVQRYIYAMFFHSNNAPAQSFGLQGNSNSVSRVFRDVCLEEPPYHTAEELSEGLKHGDEGARLLIVFYLRLRKNGRMRCRVEKAIAAEGTRWVGVLIDEAWRLFLLMRHCAVLYQVKPKSVVAIEGRRAQRRILARSGLARYTTPSVKERAAVKLQSTWNKIHQQWFVLCMDNWYNKHFTTNPDKNYKSLNAQRWPSCYYEIHHATGMVLLASKRWNGVFLLWCACWGALSAPLPVSCVI